MGPLFLIPLYLGTTLLPITLAWTGTRPARSFWDEIATGTGMLAFAVILVEFVLSGRFRSVSRSIGMDVTMRFHQLFARTALVLALIHPFFYHTSRKPQMAWDPTRQLSVAHDFESLSTGILAWVLLPAFVLISIGRTRSLYSYEAWRLMHGLGALLIAGCVLHHALAAGRYSQDPIVAGAWVSMFAIALLTLIFIYLIEPIRQRYCAWIVSSVKPLALKTWEITIEPDGHAGLKYEAGQFVWLNIGHSSFSFHENPFSISSAPSSGDALQFVIKELGNFTNTIGKIKSGTQAYLDGPHGNLTISHRPEPGIALIAGGIGIAPLIGILRQLRLENDRRPTLLVYGNGVEDQIACREELKQLSSDHGTIVVHALMRPGPSWDGHVGGIDAKIVKELFQPEMRKWLFVLCGPDAMMELVEDSLIDLGVPPRQILSERFKYD
ncbi:MAG: ferredoxin reductase family protein [Hyphomicrobiaceae bacterium]